MDEKQVQAVIACLKQQKLNMPIPGLFILDFPLFFRGMVNITDILNLECLAMDAYSSLGAKSLLTNTICGRYSTIGNNVNGGVGMHAINEFSTSACMYNIRSFKCVKRENSVYEQNNGLYCSVHIGHDVHINNDVLILNNINIGHGAVLMPNTIVNRDIPPYAIVSGHNKIVGYRYSDEIISDLLELNWWDFDLPQMLEKGINIPRHDIKSFIQFFKDLKTEDKIFLPTEWNFIANNKGSITFGQVPEADFHKVFSKYKVKK